MTREIRPDASQLREIQLFLTEIKRNCQCSCEKQQTQQDIPESSEESAAVKGS